MTDTPRLIEVAFPLKQASLDSVHEKNVRHGHISTLHIWPARRPLAACRAALIATLLPDPGTPEKRKELLEKIGGKVVTEVQKKKVGGKTVETIKERTEGGVLRWGNENSPDMDWFREEIKKAYGGRAPRVLDPFAGGGAIPLEAMRLGCEATAIDINPVAWFILKCTLEYPQKLAGQTRPLPEFALESAEFMEAFLKGTGEALQEASREGTRASTSVGSSRRPRRDLAWHVRAWGWWVLQEATARPGAVLPDDRRQADRRLPLGADGDVQELPGDDPAAQDPVALQEGQQAGRPDDGAERRRDGRGLRRPERCAGCRAASGSDSGSTTRTLGAGTMSRSGATCPCCCDNHDTGTICALKVSQRRFGVDDDRGRR